MFYLVNRFDKRADEFGAGLDSFLNPTLRCNSFLTTAPSIEVRAYVSYFLKVQCLRLCVTFGSCLNLNDLD